MSFSKDVLALNPELAETTPAWIKGEPNVKKTKVDYKAMLVDQLAAAGVPAYKTEYRFAKPARQWRFDYAWPLAMVAVEYEGMSWQGGTSGHMTLGGYEGDCEKYSEAAVRGWIVIRVTATMVRDGRALGLLLRALKLEAGV